MNTAYNRDLAQLVDLLDECMRGRDDGDLAKLEEALRSLSAKAENVAAKVWAERAANALARGDHKALLGELRR
jgi:hypothetical protein